MFVLSRISDLIRIEPSKFSKPTDEAIEEEINTKYANKVLPDLGLCVCLYDLLEVGDAMIKHGDSGAFVRTLFRLVVFRPFAGEVMIGTISSCSQEGLRVRTEFFEDIFIPKEYLFPGCLFIPREQAWIWRTDEQDLYLDVHEPIRFRIEQEIFTDQSPQGPRKFDVRTTGEAREETAVDANQAAAEQMKLLRNGTGFNLVPPYSLIASCQTPGMGLLSWW
ncbi:RNA polymerase III subunit Rpc25-domain-containing protein [Lipomyces oligophaga]|uniref:RNA polymerase III subunit Rpc25-domain-containing protein n=1 Tax=Lipomyces oligophaga TaxID=45792 RepID=UPI0034CE6D99